MSTVFSASSSLPRFSFSVAERPPMINGMRIDSSHGSEASK